MKIMIEMDSIHEFQKILQNSPGSTTATEQFVAEPTRDIAQNAGNCASINLKEGNSASPNSLFTDKSRTLFYGQSPIEHRDFDNINTAGRYNDNTLTGNPPADFSNFSQAQVTSLPSEPTTESFDEGISQNAGACFQTGFNPN